MPYGSSAFTTATSRGPRESNRIFFARKYSSIDPWKSKWSCVKFVNTAARNSRPFTRDIDNACEETSITAATHPERTISARSALSSSDSGVVWVAGISRSPIR